ncbi:MAG: hypothetical protein V4689_08180 [Verrucomicrobiota bacterium]
MNIRPLPAVLTLAAALAGHCLAVTPILEEFESGKIDQVRWYQHRVAKGKLSQSDGLLNFRVLANPAPDNFASMELMTSQPGFDENWEFTLDISNTANQGTKSGIGFMIFNGQDRDDYLYVEYHGNSGISAGVFTNLSHAPAVKLSSKFGLPQSAIRVRFGKKIQLLTFFLSETLKEEGYIWQKVGTYSPTGAGGDVNAKWKMKAVGGTFGIQLFGFGVSKPVPAGKLTIDNFELTGDP